MERYTKEQRVYIVEQYFRNNESLAAAVRKFNAKFGRNNGLSSSTVKRLVKKFKETGSVEDAKRTGRPKTSRSDLNIEAVREIIGDNPVTSIRRLGQELKISRSSLHRILSRDLCPPGYSNSLVVIDDKMENNSTEDNFDQKPKTNHWSFGLLKTMKDPNYVVMEDDFIIAILDTYPKAQHHYLVCPKEDIPSLRDVTLEHLTLLKHMHETGKTLADKHKDSDFLLGYHAVPSMTRLHLHVISDDFDSPSLKTHKHWNSFTTEFFLNSEEIINQLETDKFLTLKRDAEYKNFLKKPLKCHKCDYSPKFLPDLKLHLKSHLNNE